MRADQLLVARQLAATRSQAQRLIAAGVRWRLGTGDWQTVRKSGDDIPPDAQLELLDEAEARYVSRGGLKLEGALAAGGHVLMLVKPQFELQPEHIGKGGIVRDATLYAQVEQRLRAACASCGLAVQHWLPSAIAGGDGNREFFVHAVQVA